MLRAIGALAELTIHPGVDVRLPGFAAGIVLI
jgi:hypothetical protein